MLKFHLCWTALAVRRYVHVVGDRRREARMKHVSRDKTHWTRSIVGWSTILLLFATVLTVRAQTDPCRPGTTAPPSRAS
jgi:hypothetical protein